jgi:hypothetical protein
VERAKVVVMAAAKDVVIDNDDASKKCKEAGGSQDSLAMLGFNDNQETKKTNKQKSAPRSLAPDGPGRRNPVRSSRAMTINESCSDSDKFKDDDKCDSDEFEIDPADDDESIAKMESKGEAKD